MDSFVEAKLSLDVNSEAMPVYRVEMEVPSGGQSGTVYGTGYSLQDAVREALRGWNEAMEGQS